jgi:hypothetical protein
MFRQVEGTLTLMNMNAMLKNSKACLVAADLFIEPKREDHSASRFEFVLQ